MSAPLRAIHYPPSPSSSKKKISRFFPPWHPDVLAAPTSTPTSTSTSKSKPATSTSTSTTQKSPPNNATRTTNNFTPITIITTITSITTVTSLSPMTTTTVITDITNTTISPASNSPEPKWHRRKNSKGLKIDIMEKDGDWD